MEDTAVCPGTGNHDCLLENSEIRGYFCKLVQGRELECGIKLKMKVTLAAKLLIVAWPPMKTSHKFEASCFSG